MDTPKTVPYLRALINSTTTRVKATGEAGSGTLIQLEAEIAALPPADGGVWPCYLFFPADVPGMGNPINAAISREEYRHHPEKYGVALYRSPNRRKGVVYE